MKKVLFALAVVTLFFSCNPDKKAKLEKLRQQRDNITAEIKKLESELGNEAQTVKEKFTQISVNEVKKQPFYHYVDVQGKVDGEENIAVSAQTLGVISKIYIHEGDAVKAGQVLMELDGSVMKQGIEELKSSLKFVTDLYNKQKELWDQKIGSEVQYLQAKNNKESLENKLKTLEEQLGMTQIKSPINGTIEEIPVKVGQALSPGFNAARVVNFSKIKVVADIAEAFTAKIKEGNDVLVFFPDLDKEVKAKIRFTSKFINPVNRTFMVEVRLEPGDFEFRANMIAVLKIIDYFSKEALALPVNLIQSDSKGKYVWVAKDENGKTVAQKSYVKTGQSYNGQIEVTEGLKEGDKAISMGITELEEGCLVKM